METNTKQKRDALAQMLANLRVNQPKIIANLEKRLAELDAEVAAEEALTTEAFVETPVEDISK